MRTVVLVEGVSDRVAVETLAARRGRDLAAEGVSVVALRGAGNIRTALGRYGPQGLGVRLAGLCDAGEESAFGRALEEARLGSGLGRPEMERLGFFVCVQDLEDELIRALGVAAVEDVVAAQGELRPFRTLQKQPRSETGRPRRSCAGSSALTADGRRSTRRRSCRRSTSSASHGRSTSSSNESARQPSSEDGRSGPRAPQPAGRAAPTRSPRRSPTTPSRPARQSDSAAPRAQHRGRR